MPHVGGRQQIQRFTNHGISRGRELTEIELGPETGLTWSYIRLWRAKARENNARDLRIYGEMLMASTRPAIGVSLRRATLGERTPLNSAGVSMTTGSIPVSRTTFDLHFHCSFRFA